MNFNNVENQTKNYMDKQKLLLSKHFNKNIEIDNHINKLNNDAVIFSNNLIIHSQLIDNIKKKINEFKDKDNITRNIYVNSMPKRNKSEYIGCYNNSNNMTYTGDMNINNCKKNAYDLRKPFYSVNVENDTEKCYVGDNLNDIIMNGESYNDIILWHRDFKETMDRRNNWRKLKKLSEITYVKPYKLKILNTTIVIVDSNNTIIISNNFQSGENELEPVIEENSKTNTNTSKLILTNDGNLQLINNSNNNILWTPNQTNSDSIIVHDWIPNNCMSNKYNRSFINTNEFLNSGDSISSENGKYILEFTDDYITLKGAKSTCGDEFSGNKYGNTNTTALYTLNETLYNIKNYTESNSNAINSFSNVSLGNCINECNNNNDCNAIEYNKLQPSQCKLLPEIGATFDSNDSKIVSKNNNNPFNKQKFMGKHGYIDENNILHEYPETMLNYNEEYELINNSKSNGNIIDTFNGNDVDGILKCNTLFNCGGFNYDIKNNSISLIDNTIYPVSNKKYEDQHNLYTRNKNILSHDSCSDKTFENVNVDLWNNYEILNKITILNPDTHKCGLINFIDSDIKELNIVFNKLKNITNKINNSIKKLLDLNIDIKEDIIIIQSYVNDTMSSIIKTNETYLDVNDKFEREREGFKIYEKKNLSENLNTNLILKSLTYSLIGLLSYSFYKKYF